MGEVERGAMGRGILWVLNLFSPRPEVIELSQERMRMIYLSEDAASAANPRAIKSLTE